MVRPRASLMIRVGFLGNYSKEWMGGVNYLKNLLFALQSLPEKNVEPIVFVGADTDPSIIDSFKPYAKVVEVSVLTKKSFHWFLWRITKKLFKSDMWIELVLKRYQIDVFSHSDFYPAISKSVNWIPDFQHLHLPGMFGEDEVKFRNKSFLRSVRYANSVILSSEDALHDLKQFAPNYAQKGRVLNFVAQPKRELLLDRPEKEAEVLKKHEINGSFFYLPNQFWKHKNHQVVFEALSILKRQGKNIQLVCSGRMSDYRDETYFDTLKSFVIEQHLDVKFLGLIDYDDVIVLMKKSIAVVNPSLFEGWSSTVEECKVIGKRLILSDIGVHLEQNPGGALFFDPTEPKQLAEILEAQWTNRDERPISPINIEQETRNFAQKYLDILREALL